MMRVAFDSNVILDAIANRADYKLAQELIMAVAEERIAGIITANSITDIYYIARKTLGDEATREAIWNLLTVFDVAGVDGEDCATALSVQMKDFEDAVLAVCAAREGAEFIATRDEGFINAEGCPVVALRPADILEAIRNAEE